MRSLEYQPIHEKCFMRSPCMAAAIGRAHDNKGALSVVLRGPLSGRCRRALRRAWEEVAGEDADAVAFHAAGDPDWRAVWVGRRFDTDWRP